MNHRSHAPKFAVKELRLKTGIRYLASGSYRGEQIRRRFASREEAESFANRYNELLEADRHPSGQSVFTRLSQEQIAMAEVVYGRIGELDLLDVVTAGLASIRASAPSIPLTDMIARYIAAKEAENLSADGMANIKKRLKAFERDSGGKMDRQTIQQYLSRRKADGEALSPITIINDRAILHGMFAWAVSEELIRENPVATIRRPKAPPSRPQILTPAQAKAIISAAEKFKGGLRLPYFAMAIYAGIRPRELHRLTPENVNLKSKIITVDAESSKTRRRHRFVEIQPILARLLKGRKIAPALDAKNFRRDFDAIRVLAGLMDVWQDDIMRHTFGSYHLAKFGDAKLTARQMGNSEDIVYQHYYDRIPAKDVKAFWG